MCHPHPSNQYSNFIIVVSISSLLTKNPWLLWVRCFLFFIKALVHNCLWLTQFYRLDRDQKLKKVSLLILQLFFILYNVIS